MGARKDETDPGSEPQGLRAHILMLGREPTPDELTWLDGFRPTGRGNYIMSSTLTDPRTAMTTVPFHLIVFQARRSKGPPIPGKWMWGVVINPAARPPTPGSDEPRDMVCQGEVFNGAAEAALAARQTLLDGGFELTGDPSVVAGIRMKIAEFFRQGR
jgi:hypothetical protein